MDNDIETRSCFKEVPKDYRWYSLPDDQYVRWDPEQGQWQYMIMREPGEAIYCAMLEDGVELYDVSELNKRTFARS